jgi:hypothetical protein
MPPFNMTTLAERTEAEEQESAPKPAAATDAEEAKWQVGVLAGLEWSNNTSWIALDCKSNAPTGFKKKLTSEHIGAIKSLVQKWARRDYPARLIEVIQAWEKLDVETPIATPGGWKTMGTLIAGDYVFGSNGRIVNVTAVQPISKEQSYSILFDDGSSIVASDGHTWNTQTVKERYANKPAVERSTKELFETQDKSHSIDLSPGLQTFDVELPIDPYLLGCWLGDGFTANGYVCGNLEDLTNVAKHFSDAGYKVSKPAKDGGKNSLVKNCYRVWIHGLSGTLKHLGLKRRKHIPKIYLRASISQRIALLQGLMDTDGWADGSGGCGWGQSPEKHQELISNFSELLSSLGVKHQFYPYSRERDGKIYNFQQTSFRPSFGAFRLKRKLAIQKIPKENGRTRKVYIQEIKPVGERSVRCITVDAPDHLYLAGKSMIPTHNCALFYRGFQFLIPQRGGGWIIPGESTGYGPTMQMDLALLPTNIYSARAQMIIAALTRTVPNVRFEPETADNDAQITSAESAQKFTKVITKNNDLIQIQTDASRYLWTDGRYCYWSRYIKDGPRFGWEEDDEPDDIVPENAENYNEGNDAIEVAAENFEPSTKSDAEAEGGEEEQSESEDEEDEQETPLSKRTPRGKEIRTAHGKIEVKLSPMFANTLDEVDVLDYSDEIDESRACGMTPWLMDEIRATNASQAAMGEIARLARQNIKLGMQSTYVTADSIAADVTCQRVWLRTHCFTKVEGANKDRLRDELIEMFPDGCYAMFMGDTFAFARNESINDSWALAQAYSGDGQNRNAMGTSTLPIQKRLNNWLDLMNDLFVRTIPKKWMDSKAFAVEALRQQTNVPGDIGPFKRQPGVPVAELIFIEPAINPPATLADFIKEYSGPLAELLSGAYPALAGGDVGTADSGVAIATQRDSALGRLAPTWHSIKNAEATSMKQLVRWGAKCRDKSINERIPGGETIALEINDLKGNIAVFAESDENFPETYTQKKNSMMQVVDSLIKNPQFGEIFFNAANLEFMQTMWGISEFYIPKVLARNKQLGECELLIKSVPVPKPEAAPLIEKVEQMKQQGVDPAELQAVEQQIQEMEESSIQPDPRDDHDTEAETAWQRLMDPDGRRLHKSNPDGWRNLALHYDAHVAMAQAKAAQAQPPTKPPSESINFKDVAALDKGAADQMLAKGGITPTAGAQTPPPMAPTPGAKEPAAPLPPGSPAQSGGLPKH